MNRKIVQKFQFSFSDILNVLKQYSYQQTNKNIEQPIEKEMMAWQK